MIGVQMEDSLDPYTGKPTTGFQRMLDEFNQENPNINLIFTSIPWGGTIGPYAKGLNALISGTMDVVHTKVYYRYIGLFESLDEYIERDNFDLSRILDSAVSICQAQLPEDEKTRQYMLPIDSGFRAIGFDKEIFDSYGVPYLSKDPTLEELKEKAVKLTGTDPRTGKETYGFFIRGNYCVWPFLTYVRYYGGDFAPEGGTVPNFDTEPALKALEWMVSLAKEGILGPAFLATGSNPPSWLTKANEYGIMPEIPASNLMIAKDRGLTERYGMRVNVLSPKFKTAGLLGGVDASLGISANSKHKDEAWEVVKFIISPKVQRFRFKNHIVFPTLKEAVEWDEWKALPYPDVFDRAYVIGDPQIGNGTAVVAKGRMIIRGLVNKALALKITPKEALEAMQMEIQAILME